MELWSHSCNHSWAEQEMELWSHSHDHSLAAPVMVLWSHIRELQAVTALDRFCHGHWAAAETSCSSFDVLA
jgi:hypothetical protein